MVQYNSITADYPPSQRLPVWRHINIGTVGKQNSRLNPENRDYGQPFGNNFTLILQNCVVYQRLMPVFIHTWKMNHEKFPETLSSSIYSTFILFKIQDRKNTFFIYMNKNPIISNWCKIEWAIGVKKCKFVFWFWRVFLRFETSFFRLISTCFHLFIRLFFWEHFWTFWGFEHP